MPRSVGSALEGFVDLAHQWQQLVARQLTRQSVTEGSVDPVEDAEAGVVLSVAERGLAVAGEIAADIERQAAALGVLVHELAGGAGFAGQQASAHQLVARAFQLGSLEVAPHAPAEPADEMLL